MLGVGHQAEDRSRLVHDAGDVRGRAVGVLLVAESDLAVRLQLGEELVVGVIATLPVLHGDREPLPAFAAGRERGVVPLDSERDVAADERQRSIGAKRPGKEACLAENLKTVADAEHESAVGCEATDGVHHGRETSDRPAAEVVAV